MNIKSNITTDLADRAEDELFQILLKQHIAFNARWHSSPFTIKAKQILRVIGIACCILGAALCIYMKFNTQHHLGRVKTEDYILFFFGILFLFYYLPTIDITIKHWIKSRSIKNCRKLAKKCVKAARRLAPFEAEYNVRNDLITYYRNKDGNWELAWPRKLNGIAFHGQSTTLFFRKWASIQPTIVILHEDFSLLNNALRKLNIDFKRMN